eukprot:19282_1
MRARRVADLTTESILRSLGSFRILPMFRKFEHTSNRRLLGLCTYDFRTKRECCHAMASFLGTHAMMNALMTHLTISCRDRRTGKSRGMAFVDLMSDEDVTRAVLSLHQSQLLGRRITVERSASGGGKSDRRSSFIQRSKTERDSERTVALQTALQDRLRRADHPLQEADLDTEIREFLNSIPGAPTLIVRICAPARSVLHGQYCIVYSWAWRTRCMHCGAAYTAQTIPIPFGCQSAVCSCRRGVSAGMGCGSRCCPESAGVSNGSTEARHQRDRFHYEPERKARFSPPGEASWEETGYTHVASERSRGKSSPPTTAAGKANGVPANEEARWQLKIRIYVCVILAFCAVYTTNYLT